MASNHLHQTTGDLVVLLDADRGPGHRYLADLTEVIQREAAAYGQGYSAGYAEGRADRDAEAAHHALCDDLRPVWAGPTITDMDGTDDDLRARAVAREQASTARFRASVARERGGAA